MDLGGDLWCFWHLVTPEIPEMWSIKGAVINTKSRFFSISAYQCAQTCMDANETLSTTGSHVGKVTALPVQEELSSCLTAAWQAHGAAHLDGRQTRTFYPGFEAP